MRLTNRIKIPETKGEFATVKSADSDHYLEINWYEGQEVRSGDMLDHIAFEVDDLNSTVDELSCKGMKTVTEIRESQNSKWTYIKDSDGIWIELFQKQ